MMDKYRFALIILTDKITIRKFEFKDDWDMARQAVITAGKTCIPLKWHFGVNKWVPLKTLEF